MRLAKLFIALVFLCGAASAEERIEPLTESDVELMERQRAVVYSRIADDSQANLDSTAGKLGALRALLDAGIFAPEQTYELQSLGVVLGDAFAQELGLSWVTYSDENGRDLALRYKDTSLILFPVTMISKRVEDGEDVDVFGLFNGVAEIVEERIAAMEAR